MVQFFCLRLKQFFSGPFLKLENPLQTFRKTAVSIRAPVHWVGLLTPL